MAKLVNLTPHPINVIINNKQITIPPSGKIARVLQEQEIIDYIQIEEEAIAIVLTRYKVVDGLPEPQKDTIYITSSLVAQLAKRKDVVSPNTNEAIRDSEGNIIAVNSFQTFT